MTENSRGQGTHWHPQNEPGPGGPAQEAIERGYERDTVSVRRVLITTGAFLAFLIFANLLMLDAFRLLDNRAKSQEVGPLISLRQAALPPQLDPNQARALRNMREAEQRVLSSYGPADPQQGTVRIPIERAMDIWLHRQSAKHNSPGSRP